MNRLYITIIASLLPILAVMGQNQAQTPVVADSTAVASTEPAVSTPRNPILGLFTQMPDSVMPLLTRNARLDMVDYHTAGLTNGVNNRMENPCRILSSSANEMTILTGNVSRIQLAMLPARADTLVAIIETVDTPQPDSHITFRRTSDWAVVPQRDTITMADFLTDRNAEATEVPAMFFCSITYDGESGLFVFTNTTGDRYTSEEAPAYMSKLLPQVKATFDGRRWKVRR